MAVSLGFYLDANLTQPLTSSTLTLDRLIGGPPVDVLLFLGSTVTGRAFVGAVNDGPIVISVVDSVPTNDGFVPADFSMALTQAELDTASAGTPLTINGGITSGAANAKAFWLRFLGTSTAPKTSTDLSLTTNEIKEIAA